MQFGNRLKLLRKEKDFTQSDLAKVFSLGESTISFYESNKRTPDYELLKKIADFFDVSVDYLLCRTDIRNKQEKILEEKYPDINDAEKAIGIILSQSDLMLKGELLTDESKIILTQVMQTGFNIIQELRKARTKKF